MANVGKTYQAKQNLFISKVVVKTTTGDNLTKSCCGVFFERLHACLSKSHYIDHPTLTFGITYWIIIGPCNSWGPP